MIDLTDVSFALGVEPIGEEALRHEASRLFDEWERRVADMVPLSDYALYVELEEGSLKGRGRIAGRALAVLLAIEHFDGFASGVERLASVGRTAASFFVEEARSLVPPNQNAVMRAQRTAGDIGQLERLFVKARNRELDPREAAERAAALLSRDPEVTPEMLHRFEQSILTIPRVPQQLRFELDDERLAPEEPKERAPRRSPCRPETPTFPIPTPDLYRVEVWRESRKGKRRVTSEHL